MQATILNGMHAGDDMMSSLHRVVLDVLGGQGWETHPFVLHGMDIKPCAGCFGCWVRTPGRCVRPDSDDIAQAVVRSDLLLFLTPVTFGGYSSQLKKGVDRLIFANLPFFRTVDGETNHKPRYERVPSLLAIGVLPQRDGESERIFRTLVERNGINMFAPSWAAGFITRGQTNGAPLGEVRSLLSKVGVG